jgi:signal transduction histidine kinase
MPGPSKANSTPGSPFPDPPLPSNCQQNKPATCATSRQQDSPPIRKGSASTASEPTVPPGTLDEVENLAGATYICSFSQSTENMPRNLLSYHALPLLSRHIGAHPTMLVFLLLAFVAPSSHAQMVWFKYKGNPVLDFGPNAAWEEKFIHITRVIHRDSLYKMWYSGGFSVTRTGYAISRDGISWKKYPLNPVLDVTPGGWDSKAAHRGYVLANGSSYSMWYNGDSLGKFYIGYATSKDGVHWQKHPQPVFSPGGPGSWDREQVGSATVFGPDSSGGFKMWYSGQPGWQIGYATAKDETTWTRNPGPVFWSDKIVYQARVLATPSQYEMWYSEGAQPAPFGYAISTDGLHWVRAKRFPVFPVGPRGTWDDEGLTTGDVMLEGNLYRMWYNGDDGSAWRGGYAVSPRGATVDISASNAYVTPGRERVRIRLRVKDPSRLSFTARFVTPGPFQANPLSPLGTIALREAYRLELLDDGKHDDGLAHDGLFANSWIPQGENLHFVNLELATNNQRESSYVDEREAVFTTIGPVRLDSVGLLTGGEAHPGDTVLVRLSLRNEGKSSSARSVRARLFSDDPSIAEILESSPIYGEIPPGAVVATTGYYKIVVNPFSPKVTRARVNVIISSWGIPFWRDSFTLRITPPWWKTTWAYITYVVLLIGSSVGTVRYFERVRLQRRIASLERERAIERERVRISQDMHDEVGAQLTEIGILSELAKHDLRNPEAIGEQVQKIADTSREAMANIGEIIWAINPKNDSLEDLVAYTRESVSRFTAASGIRCSFLAPKILPSMGFTANVRRNLYLAVKEAVHNIVKHSGAREVRIEFSVRPESVSIFIEDDGRGFDASQASRFGNGLSNMQRRMNDIGGTFSVESGPSRGTIVKLVYSPPNRAKEG